MTTPAPLLSTEGSQKIPSAMVSEAIISERAPAALKVLAQNNALDLTDILGLSSYKEGRN